MRITAIFILCCLLMPGGPIPGAGAADLSLLVGQVQKAVVTVVTYDIHRRVSGFGSGFIVDDKGHIITSRHVADGAYDIEVRLNDGDVFAVEAVVAESAEKDLVQLRAALPAGFGPPIPLTDRAPKIAEPILVVGSPMGLERTVSEGIVSAVRKIPGSGEFFQISAPISQGSSGGPVLNMKGQVIGVVTFMVAVGQNLNFAVSASGIERLEPLDDSPTVADWTHRRSLQEPDRAEELCREGFKFSINGEYSRALSFYRSAAEKDPTSVTAWRGLGFCYTGLDRRDRAIETYRKAVRINPDNAELRLLLADILTEEERYEDAVRSYGNAIRLDPDLAEAHARLAVVLTEMGRYAEAVDHHRTVIRLDPASSPAYFNLGITFGRQARWEAAADAYRRAVLLDPDNLYAHHNLGVTLSRLGQDAAAADAHKRVIRLDPDHAPSHFHLGKAYLRLGDKPSALDQYKILKGLDPGLSDKLFGEMYP